jgi:hypothetical protein
VEQWDERVKMARQNRGWKDGGLDIEDMALVGFIKLMKYLRVVLLQDMAVLQVGKYIFLLYN